jgi:rhodanese-related sulfurtransferase
MNNFYSELSVFLIQHWQLSIAFVAVAGIWAGFELRYTFNGVPKLSPTQATLLINRQEAMIVDVRDNSNFAKGHLQGAINIPIVDLPQGNGRLDKNKDKEILIVCQQGMQSGQAAATLKKQGFTKISILKGGVQAWSAEHLPVVKGTR